MCHQPLGIQKKEVGEIRMEFLSSKNNLDFLNLTGFGKYLKVQLQSGASYTETLILTRKMNMTLLEQESFQTPI